MSEKTVLIADGSLVDRALLGGALGEDYDILEAADGRKALDILREKGDSIAAMLLDIALPVKDGYQVMAEMHQDERISWIPVVMMVTASETSVEMRALDAGAIDFLTKPIDSDIAKRRIESVVDQRELEELHIKSRIADELQYQSGQDELTGIYSRKAFYEKTQKMFTEKRDSGYIIIRCDIEKFKLVNELFGVEVGDEMLKAAANSVAKCVGDMGTYGRFGSDNFVICVSERDVDAQQLMDQIVVDIRGSFEDAGLTQLVIVASGVYRVTEEDVQIGQMCDRAGMALQTIKGDYDCHIAYYDNEMRERLLEEQDILDNMEEALANGEFEVYLQPVYSLSTRHPASAEALVRWNRPGKGIVSPGVFIPLFERNGFISKLDYNVWDQVCRIQMTRAEKGLSPLPISVNLSRKSVYNPHLFDEIVALTDRYGVVPHLFRIEVTESAYMDNAAQLIQTVSNLQEHGFLVLMDDFGSGYSSFNTLKDIPVDMLKVDMKFMEGFENDGRVGTILTSILRMTKWLGIPVIAEGVETAAQYEFLRSLGCDYAQGFYFARPMAYQDFESHLAGALRVIPDEHTSFEAEDVNDIMGAGRLFSRVMDDMLDAYAIYEFRNDALEVVRANSGYFRLFDYDMDSFKKNSAVVLDCVVKADRTAFITACRQAMDSNRPQNTVVCRLVDGSSFVRLHATCSCVSRAGRNTALLFIAYRVIDSGNADGVHASCPFSPENVGKKIY